MPKTPRIRARMTRFLDCRQPVIVAGRPLTRLNRPIVFEEIDHSEHQLQPITVPMPERKIV